MATFPLFEQLPPELRQAIWSVALPDRDDDPAVYVARTPLAPRPDASLAHVDCDPMSGSSWSDNSVGRRQLIEVALPSLCRSYLHVCRESRTVVLTWASRRGYKLFYRKETGGHIFVRDLDLARDVVYIPDLGLHWHRKNPPLRQNSAHLKPDSPERADGLSRYIFFTQMQHVSFSVWQIRHYYYKTFDLIVHMPNLKSLSVIWERWPNIYPKTWKGEGIDSCKVTPRYELEDADYRRRTQSTEPTVGVTLWDDNDEGPEDSRGMALDEFFNELRRRDPSRFNFSRQGQPDFVWAPERCLGFKPKKIVWRHG